MSNNYPSNWEDIKNVLFERYNNACANCGRSSTPLEAHHIVPVSAGGSHKLDNLAPLCPQCHGAIHSDRMAPTVRWYTNGDLSDEEFGEHKRLWKRLQQKHGVPRYDSDRDCVYIPLADTDLLIN
jgi:ribosomal protein S27AE